MQDTIYNPVGAFPQIIPLYLMKNCEGYVAKSPTKKVFVGINQKFCHCNTNGITKARNKSDKKQELILWSCTSLVPTDPTKCAQLTVKSKR